jgi:uncharacterized BrkB/YihY/UPF0761 family membrane protein
MNDDELLLEMHRHTLRRTRRFWIWMAIMGGLPIFPLSVALFRRANTSEEIWPLIVGACLAYAGWCASKILRTVTRLTFDQKAAVWIPLTLLLGANSQVTSKASNIQSHSYEYRPG